MRTAIAGVLIAGAVLAQQSANKFESTTQLVVVNVSAKDKSGKLLDGLKASDFVITEDGKPQQIKVFEIPASGGGRFGRAGTGATRSRRGRCREARRSGTHRSGQGPKRSSIRTAASWCCSSTRRACRWPTSTAPSRLR